MVVRLTPRELVALREALARVDLLHLGDVEYQRARVLAGKLDAALALAAARRGGHKSANSASLSEA